MRLSVASLLLLATLDAYAASFDCAKAATKVESMVCTDTTLSALDDTMSDLYGQAAALTPDDAEPKQSQRAWLRQRNACTDADCIAAAYRKRIAELEDTIGQDLSADAVAGTYTRDDADHSTEREPAEIRVRALPDGRVAIEGEALWIGNAETGNVNTGTLEGTHELRGGAIAYRDGDDDWSCVLTLRFARETLEVDEPRRTCGGMNVSFGGRYFRTTAPAEQ
ncbi:MAG TPA: lysozyme inhibitor LprI family protein [Patescibacteria group bacterium]|nr:lysozyme inhibitor LprI family protein [Patescibacteria group bacterium]